MGALLVGEEMRIKRCEGDAGFTIGVITLKKIGCSKQILC